jgi:hypothetical protein
MLLPSGVPNDPTAAVPLDPQVLDGLVGHSPRVATGDGEHPGA